MLQIAFFVWIPFILDDNWASREFEIKVDFHAFDFNHAIQPPQTVSKVTINFLYKISCNLFIHSAYSTRMLQPI